MLPERTHSLRPFLCAAVHYLHGRGGGSARGCRNRRGASESNKSASIKARINIEDLKITSVETKNFPWGGAKRQGKAELVGNTGPEREVAVQHGMQLEPHCPWEHYSYGATSRSLPNRRMPNSFLLWFNHLHQPRFHRATGLGCKSPGFVALLG